MKRYFWFLLAAVFLSSYAIYLILDSPLPERERQVQGDSFAKPKSRAGPMNQDSVDVRTDSYINGPAGRARPQIYDSRTTRHSSINSEKTQQNKRLDLSSEKPADSEIIDTHKDAVKSDAQDRPVDGEDEEVLVNSALDDSEEEDNFPEENPSEELLIEDELPENEEPELLDETALNNSGEEETSSQ